MTSSVSFREASTDPAIVLGNATTRAAEWLGIRQSELSEIIGVPPAAVTCAGDGGSLPEDCNVFELATLFVRTVSALDAFVGGDKIVAAAWMRNHNMALGGEPLMAIKTGPGLVNCLAYLEARRALV